MFTTLLMRHLKEARNLDILYVTSVYNTKGRMSLPSFSLKKKLHLVIYGYGQTCHAGYAGAGGN